MLAVSFHATTDDVRNRLVPINRRWNIEALLDDLPGPDLAAGAAAAAREATLTKPAGALGRCNTVASSPAKRSETARRGRSSVILPREPWARR